jgi:hypothetical protein
VSLEGLDAFENDDGTAPAAPKSQAKSRKKTPVQPKPIESDESGESGGSEDEYVGEEDEKPPQDRGKSSKKVCNSLSQSSFDFNRAFVETSGRKLRIRVRCLHRHHPA